ncbi:alanine racemase [Algoriphagus lacus]|uniref:Alanine racemase n=1 Tax=Algoriphagus lacus TaxID=2056311 RepID=A0A418PNE2_9BACT|nr:alanine racemase [Algoriphagus lacus]RIW13348.1 alanine racemase [Algoriphagus lacus]
MNRKVTGSPTLLLDVEKCKRNINLMASKAKRHGLIFRPHFKTHQSLEIGQWFKAEGVSKITVSSLVMAEYFASEWDDITVAFPVNILEIDRINSLANRITLNLLVENTESVTFLAKHLHFRVNLFLKIDVGYHRTGIDPGNLDLIEEILQLIESSPFLRFSGFLAHAGHTYRFRNAIGIEMIHRLSLAMMRQLKEYFSSRFPGLIISLGDTPSCSLAENFTDLDEIRPGNFVFYDLTQHAMGSNSVSTIAVAMECPIVSIHKDRGELIIYGGGVHFSKDRLDFENGFHFGRVVEKKPQGWGDPISGMYVTALSQEHGKVAVPSELIGQFKIGDTLLILPVHSCMTANAMKGYLTLEGKWIKRCY